MIKIINGDITVSNCDAIVNAANKTLLGGGGVDGAIHFAAGDSVLLECAQVPSDKGIRCKTGDAVITSAGNLNSKFIIHTVGPIFNESLNPEQELAKCYESSILLAIKNGCKSIAFPAISTGVYGFPPDKAKQIAMKECEKHQDIVDINLYFF